ncbi:ornithine cyclodeaminase family protein [Actinomadura alba]|uniref:Ornithine cyclodeaminase family protein n=1 Tax=Actinomadura alba TaxID=406431 RepID=A0ABR7LQH6_9ACTN|nr:ornithine cyclodeaminase family protein [Actinomadura alba]MBC6467107.1 ornithine cyclodeaminase family protein [Actinomadura alba]
MLHIDAAALAGSVTEAGAADLIERALAGNLDPAADPGRTAVEATAGQLLLMPAVVPGYTGVKIATVAPGNPARGRPRIQGVYALFDGPTLTPVALLDAVALTAVRTPAVSAVAVRHLAPADARRLVVFGTGPQAWGHIMALRAVRPVDHVAVVGRGGTARFVDRCRAAGLTAVAAGPDAVGDADLVACCTSAREPLFPGRLVADHAVVVAVGSHEPSAREVDADLVARATVVVESRGAAEREAGDLILARESGAVREDHVAGDLADLVAGRIAPAPGRPALFKSVGMAWEDLVVAVAVYERIRDGGR